MSNSQRFQRQIMLAEIGEAGQAKLNAARVLIVGMGGLGCPAALYLAAVGVGHLTLLDHDKVDMSNLHRQVLYGTADVGAYKATQAKERLVGSEASIVSITEALNPSNALDLVRSHDFE
jgi:adenylyltransferase/sulfurtransferase